MTVAAARPPLTRPSQRLAARYRSRLIPETTVRFPINMKRGMMISVYRDDTEKVSPAMTARTA